jgi:CDP-glucose 4,6-dehydratase
MESLEGRVMGESWEGKRVLITGTTGMVGSWLAKDLIKRNASVVALVRDIDYQTEFYRSGDYLKANIVNGALEDFSVVQRAINEHEIDTVFHLGAQTIVGAGYREPLQTFESNIRGTYNLLESCRRHSDIVKGIVIASSDKAYGISEKLPYTEDMPLKGSHPYDVSKTCTDLLAQTYFNTYGLPLAIARCGNIYGGGDLNWSRIVPGTIRSLLNNQRPVIRSNGKMVREYIYIKDVTDAYLRLAESADKKGVSGEAFNFSTESRMTVLEILNAVRDVMGRNDLEPMILSQDLKEIPEQSLSAKKAKKVLGWQSKYDLKKGISETVDWYKEFFSARD